MADEQVVIGSGATGVILQVLQAVTSPGEKMVMTYPTFDGYPIFAQMARLESVTVPLDAHGHQDLDAMADAAADARVVAVCRPHNPTGTIEPAAEIERFLRRIRSDTVVLLDEAYVEFLLTGAPDRRVRTLSSGTPMSWWCAPSRRPTDWPACGSATASALRTWPAGCGACSSRSASASPAWWRWRPPMTRKTSCGNAFGLIASERRYLRMRLRSMGVYSTDGHANFLYLPAAGRSWRHEFDAAGVRVRHFADGGVRVTVGGRASTRAVLAALA